MAFDSDVSFYIQLNILFYLKLNNIYWEGKLGKEVRTPSPSCTHQ